MARSHHRKKHKQHLQHFKTKATGTAEKAQSKGSTVFAVGGAVFGFAIGYIVSSGSGWWMIAGLLLGAAGGYFLGKKIDADKEEKK